MYQALVSHFELFDNYFCHKLSEFYYCKKNVWSYNIRINSLWLWAVGWGGGGGYGRNPKGLFGQGCTAILFKPKNILFATLFKIRNLISFFKTDIVGLDLFKILVSHLQTVDHQMTTSCLKLKFKVTRPSYFVGVPSYFEAFWYPHLYFDRKSNIQHG